MPFQCRSLRVAVFALVLVGLFGYALYSTIFLPPPDFVKKRDGDLELLGRMVLSSSLVNTSQPTPPCDFHFVSYGYETLPWRLGCGPESAALLHPDALICIHHLDLQDPILFDSYSNIRLIPFNLPELFSDTPLSSFYSSGSFKTGLQPLFDLSDALRFALLWKFDGGVYADLDQLFIQNIDHLIYSNTDTLFPLYNDPTHPHQLASGLMIIRRPQGRTSALLNRILNDFETTFSPSGPFGQVGPALLTSSYYRLSPSNQATITLMPPSSNFAIPFASYPHFSLSTDSAPSYGSSLLDSLMSQSVGCHVWSRINESTIRFGTVLSEVYSGVCPVVWSERLRDVMERNERRTSWGSVLVSV